MKNQSYNQKIQQFLERTQKKVESVTTDQPIVGLRVWKVVMEGGLPKLRSVYKETVWPYRKALERDVLDDMGIHAVKPGRRSPSVSDPGGIGMDVLSLFTSYQADVAGEVYLWGKVTEHEQGYLADFAYPKRLFPHSNLDPIVAMQLEDEYGVPCIYREEFVKAQQMLEVKAPSTTAATSQLYPGAMIPATPSQAYQQMQQALQATSGNYGLIQNAFGNAIIIGYGFYKSPFGSP